MSISLLKNNTLGRLGNQLIRYSAVYNFSKLNNIQFKIDDWYYEKYLNLPSEKYDNNENGKPYFIINNDNFFNNHNIVDYNFLFDGFFQNTNMFDINFNNIFKLKDEYLKKLIKFDDNSCSIHFRRGDYVTANDTFFTLSDNYYNDAIDIIGEDKVYYIFSDDLPYAENFIKKRNVKYNIMNNIDIIDLFNMSICKNKIIANSTFSVCSVYLNNIGVTVAPKKWYNDGLVTNVMLDDFIKI